MIIEHFGGKAICDNIKDVENVLNYRTEKGVNEFWIYGETKYPLLGLLVNKGTAYLHYFVNEGEPGFQSIGNDNLELDENENSIFYTNTDTEEVSIPNYSIITFTSALKAVKEFFETNDMPQCIEWDEM